MPDGSLSTISQLSSLTYAKRSDLHSTPLNTLFGSLKFPSSISQQPPDNAHAYQHSFLAKVFFQFYQNKPLQKIFRQDAVLQQMIRGYGKDTVLKLLQVAAFFSSNCDSDTAKHFESFIQTACPFITDAAHRQYLRNAFSDTTSLFYKCIQDAEHLEAMRRSDNFDLNQLHAFQDLQSKCVNNASRNQLQFRTEKHEHYFEVGLSDLFQMALAQRHCLRTQGRAISACSISFQLPNIDTANKTDSLFIYNGKVKIPAVAVARGINLAQHKLYLGDINLIEWGMHQLPIFKKFLTVSESEFEEIYVESADVSAVSAAGAPRKLPDCDLKFQLMALESTLETEKMLHQDDTTLTTAIDGFKKDITTFRQDITNQRKDKTEVIKAFSEGYRSHFGNNKLQHALPAVEVMVSSVIASAAIFAVGAAIGFTVGFVMGAWTGPGAALTAITGALLGGAKLVATVAAWGIIGSTAVAAAASAKSYPALRDHLPLLNNGMFGQRHALHVESQTDSITQTAEKFYLP